MNYTYSLFIPFPKFEYLFKRRAICRKFMLSSFYVKWIFYPILKYILDIITLY